MVHLWSPTVNVSGTVTALGGAGGTSSCGTAGGAGGIGRIRIDASSATCALTGTFNPTLASGCSTSGAIAGRVYVANFSSGLGGVCTVGVGACQRTGAYVCSGDGTGTVCSVTAGAPSAEVCNSVDDDCDGAIDDGAGC